MDDSFDTRIQEAMQAPPGDAQNRHLEAVWRAFFALPSWVFPVRQVPDTGDPKPFLGTIDGKGWLFAFTDAVHARGFAGDDPRFVDASGNALVLDVPMPGALDWALSFEALGVYGLRVNQGDFGWQASFDELRDWHRRLAPDAAGEASGHA